MSALRALVAAVERMEPVLNDGANCPGPESCPDARLHPNLNALRRAMNEAKEVLADA